MKNKKALWIALAVLLVLALAAAVFFLTRQPDGPVTNVSQTYAFEEEQTQETAAPSAARGIRIPGYSVIPVPADQTQVKVDLYNPEDNGVYFQIAFLLRDGEEEELLYESKLLKPGQHLYDITLNRGLPAGDHPVTIRYSTFTTDGEFSPRNGATVECIIRAQ